MSQYEVGQTVVLSSPYAHDEHTEGTVTKVARKYVTVGEGYSARKFDMETDVEFISGGYIGGNIYSLVEWADLVARTTVINELRKLGVEFRYGASRDLTSADLTEIIRIVLARNTIRATKEETAWSNSLK